MNSNGRQNLAPMLKLKTELMTTMLEELKEQGVSKHLLFTYLKHIIVNSVGYGAFMDDSTQKGNYE